MFERFVGLSLIPLLGFAGASALAAGMDQIREVGVARVDITPDYPVRLSGYAARKGESEGVAQHIWAKALAVGSDREHPAILITVENCGVPAVVSDEVKRRLHEKKRIEPDHVAICSTHTHSAPCLDGALRNLFGGPLPADQQARIARYTRETTDALERVALEALADRQPATLSRGRGEAGFSANRRTPPGGPTDHDLPVLVVTGTNGAVRAIFATYACHGTTLGGDFNQICGDWPGFAGEFLEKEHTNSEVLISLGCAADANPFPRGTLDLTKQHGEEIRVAVDSVLTNALTPVMGRLVCREKKIELPLAALPTRGELETRAQTNNYEGKFAKLLLARLDRGEKLPTRIPYQLQTWTFGDDLVMVFLSGEVVVDYALRLKQEFDPSRLWINAYANDVPCYIPSERILKEGGYEGGGAMIFYDWPGPLAPGVENAIVEAVHKLVPREFACAPKKNG